MTGKEALDYYTKTYKNPDNTIVPEKEWLFDVIGDDLKLLDKYKRAFEILKRCLRINVQELKGVYFAMGYNTNELLTKEEYELLEELME